jgi:hypothetical protein
MKATDDALRAMITRAAAAGPSQRADCLSSEALMRVAEAGGRAAEESVVEHLAICPDCADEYRIAIALRPWAQGAGAALGAPSRLPVPVRAAPKRLVLALAAVVLLCLGLSGGIVALWRQRLTLETRIAAADGDAFQSAEPARVGQTRDAEVAQLRRQLHSFDRVQTDVPVIDLFPRDVDRGGTAPVATATVSPETAFVVLLLNLSGGTHQTSYFIEIRDASGTLAWSVHCSRHGDEALTLGVPGRLLSSDSYRILIYGDSAAQPLIEQYALRIVRR